jgi:AcrR family transcriptional regulator
MTRSGGRGARRRPADSPPSEADRIIDAVLRLIPTEGWRRLTLAAIATEAGLPILQVYRVFRSKQAILGGFVRRIDEIVLAEPPVAEPDERPRDRVFELLMRRFDALQPFKAALDVLRRELPGDPVAVLCAGSALLRSMRWMLEAANVPTGGIRGAVAVRLAAMAYLSTIRVWQGDDSPDRARTMSALDARLRRVEGAFGSARATRRGGEPLPA